MRRLRHVLGTAFLVLAAPSLAHAQVPVVFGTSWDGPANSLQNILNTTYGPGAINVATDYIGHDAGDPDPFYWVDGGFTAVIIKEVAGNANNNVVGWYRETGAMPVIDGVDDGVVFTGPANASNPPVMVSLGGVQHFGFYMNPNGAGGAINAPEPEKFFSNRRFNDIGPNGTAVHVPLDGDVQALVFDISHLRGPNTWLVCFEDLDSGAQPAGCCTPTDNDFNDFIFEVSAVGVTPVVPASFGGLKVRYR